jgi:ketosteroid isomerase-like protein
MRRLVPCCLLVGVLATAGCAQAPAVDMAAERAALAAADARYGQILTSLDMDAWMSMYAPEAMLYPPNEATVTGPDNIRKFADDVKATPGFSITIAPGQVEVAAGGDLGYTMGTYDMSFTGPDGQPMTDRGRDFHVWKKQADGSWKIIVDIWNSDVPLPAPPSK